MSRRYLFYWFGLQTACGVFSMKSTPSFDVQNETIQHADCRNGICQNNGTCFHSAMECICKPGYTGNQCENDVDECTCSPCHEKALCMNTDGSYECLCDSGYHGDGMLCIPETKPCVKSQCQNNGTCMDKVTHFECICPYGVQGNFCEIVGSSCDSKPCRNSATCVNTEEGYACICQRGFEGKHCEMKENLPPATTKPMTVTVETAVALAISFGILLIIGWVVWAVPQLKRKSMFTNMPTAEEDMLSMTSLERIRSQTVIPNRSKISVADIQEIQRLYSENDFGEDGDVDDTGEPEGGAEAEENEPLLIPEDATEMSTQAEGEGNDEDVDEPEEEELKSNNAEEEDDAEETALNTSARPSRSLSQSFKLSRASKHRSAQSKHGRFKNAGKTIRAMVKEGLFKGQ